MPVFVRVEIHQNFLKRLLFSSRGAVGRDMRKRGERVIAAAKRNINSRSGELARSLHIESINGSGVRVGTSLSYARYVHDGTGVYGPRGRPVRAPRKQPFVFNGRTGQVYTQSFVGQRGTKFLENALRAAR